MTRDFTSFSTVFQSYQDDGHVIRKLVCKGVAEPYGSTLDIFSC